MKKNQSKIAQYIVDTEEEETYGLLLDRCIQVAIKLKNEGITKNDILCLCTNNHKQSIIPFISGIFLNVKVCSLDPSLSQEDITYLIDQVKPTIFFICLKSENLINRALHDLKLNAKIVIFNHSSFDEYLDIHVDITEFEPIFVSNLMETAVIFFSSGTTGFPKGICINHYALLGQAAVMINSGNGLSISLSYSTPYWISSVLLLTSAILSGSARVICSSYNSETFWSLLDKYKVTLTFLAPIQAIDILKDGRPDELDTSHLHMLLTGGGSLTETYIYQLRELLPGTFICQGYGQTEVGGVLTCFQSNDIADTLGLYYKPESCGRPIPGITYKVVNPENELLCEAFERGELRIKSKYIMNGYYRKNSSDTFDSAGWLKTGDIVYFDNDYFFFVVDRIKEMLKYRSWHVAPAVLEKIIATHPAVEKAVVIGIPHHEDGDHPLAVVVLRKNYENVEPEEIQNYVDAQVDDRQKLRGGVKIVNYIPLTPSGKVKRTFIRSLILNDRL